MKRKTTSSHRRQAMSSGVAAKRLRMKEGKKAKGGENIIGRRAAAGGRGVGGGV